MRPETFSGASTSGREKVARVRIGVPGETLNSLPDPLVSRCPYPDMLRSNPRCEAPGTTSRFLPASRRTSGQGRRGRLNDCEDSQGSSLRSGQRG